MWEGVGDRIEPQHVDLPSSSGHSSVSISFSLVAQPEVLGPSSLLGAVFSTASFLQLFWSPNSLNSLCTELYNSSTPAQSLPITGHRNMLFCRLWNGMFDRHRAEITVMQFTCHSLPVHQFVTVPWDFNPVPYCQPSSPTPMEYAISAVFGMACLAGSEVNIQQKQLFFFPFLFPSYSSSVDLYVAYTVSAHFN